MNQKPISFKQMRGTLALLRTSTLVAVSTLKAEALNKEQVSQVTTIVVGNDITTKWLKNNPTRKQMMVLCGAWRRFATQMQALVPEDQASVGEALKAALHEAEWMAAFDPPAQVTEVKS